MPVNRNALIRYKTIDNCLRNPYRRWTLEDLVDACSDALYEYEGIDKGISKRAVQMDIQMMRSEKLGYNAPIVVYENKYYKYEDPEYSITQTPLNEQDLKTMSEAVEVLRQFKGFSYFTEMSEIVNRLEDHIASARMKTTPVIDFEKNESLKGLDYLDTIYHAIVNEHPLQLKYRSFKARSANSFIFYPYLLKEYRNRWFVFGVRKSGRILQNLALDRIHSLEVLSRVISFQERRQGFIDQYGNHYAEHPLCKGKRRVEQNQALQHIFHARNYHLISGQYGFLRHKVIIYGIYDKIVGENTEKRHQYGSGQSACNSAFSALPFLINQTCRNHKHGPQNKVGQFPHSSGGGHKQMKQILNQANHCPADRPHGKGPDQCRKL